VWLLSRSADDSYDDTAIPIGLGTRAERKPLLSQLAYSSLNAFAEFAVPLLPRWQWLWVQRYLFQRSRKTTSANHN
jgi:hypothetical protein